MLRYVQQWTWSKHLDAYLEDLREQELVTQPVTAQVSQQVTVQVSQQVTVQALETTLALEPELVRAQVPVQVRNRQVDGIPRVSGRRFHQLSQLTQ